MTDRYVATQVIEHNGVRAFNPGDPVPFDNVVAHGYLEAGLVAREGTKAAAEAAEPPEAPLELPPETKAARARKS